MKNLLIIISFLISTGNLWAHTVSGIVYEDSNKNGKRDRNERKLENIAVSNGQDVVLTDKEGKYSFPIGNNGIVFVIKPLNYSFHLNEDNLPQFYYLHRPGGSPSDMQYKGIEPTGPLPESVDFGLIPFTENREFKVLLFGDPQVYNNQQIDYFSKAIISELEGIKGVSFGITLGDLVDNTLNLHKGYAEAVSKVGLPWYNVMGNHDMNQDAQSDELSCETFRANFGPENYAFNYGNAHFIVLDNILFPDPRDQSGYWGGYRPDQLDFVENNLKYVPKDKLIVIAQHIPLYNEGGDSFNLADRQRLYNLLKDYPNILLLSAHTHYQKQYFHTEADGLQGEKTIHEYNIGTTCGDWYSGLINETGVPRSTMRDGTPKGYAFLHVNDNKFTLDYKVAGMPKEYRIEVFNTKVISADKRNKAQLVANFFMGSEKDKVEYRIDRGEWRPMQYVLREDPLFANLVFCWDNSDTLIKGKRPSNPVQSTHIWSANISGTFSQGEHNIEVRATDMFGQVFFQQSKFNVE